MVIYGMNEKPFGNSLSQRKIFVIDLHIHTGNTPQSDTKENDIFPLLEMIIQFGKKLQKKIFKPIL